MSFIAFYLPEKVLLGIIGVSGATVFYDTIFKSFQKIFDKSKLEEGKDER